jgi:MFS family permease
MEFSAPLISPGRELRRDFAVFSVLFSINHGTVVTVIAYASSLLNTVGYISTALLYIFTVVSSLFIAAPAVAYLGTLRCAALSQILYSVYVFGFAACVLGVDAALLAPVSSILGGIAAGMLWASQGSVFSSAAAKIAEEEGKSAPEATAELGSQFAVIFLAGEVIVKLIATVLKLAVPLEASGETVWAFVFFLFSAFAFVCGAYVPRLKSLNCTPPAPPSESKLMIAIALMGDARIWLLGCTNVTFGFCAAFMNGYVNEHYVKDSPVLSASVIGLLTAITAAVAGASAPLFKDLSGRLGQGLVVLLGSLCFLMIPLSVLLGSPQNWGWGIMVLYVAQGLGRGVYESTNKVVFADFFPGNAPGAFANVMLQGSFAFALCFFFSAALEKSVHILAGIVIVFALLTYPCYRCAQALTPAK